MPTDPRPTVPPAALGTRVVAVPESQAARLRAVRALRAGLSADPQTLTLATTIRGADSLRQRMSSLARGGRLEQEFDDVASAVVKNTKSSGRSAPEARTRSARPALHSDMRPLRSAIASGLERPVTPSRSTGLSLGPAEVTDIAVSRGSSAALIRSLMSKFSSSDSAWDRA